MLWAWGVIRDKLRDFKNHLIEIKSGQSETSSGQFSFIQ